MSRAERLNGVWWPAEFLTVSPCRSTGTEHSAEEMVEWVDDAGYRTEMPVHQRLVNGHFAVRHQRFEPRTRCTRDENSRGCTHVHYRPAKLGVRRIE